MPQRRKTKGLLRTFRGTVPFDVLGQRTFKLGNEGLQFAALIRIGAPCHHLFRLQLEFLANELLYDAYVNACSDRREGVSPRSYLVRPLNDDREVGLHRCDKSFFNG